MCHYDGLPVPQELEGEAWAAIVSDAIFGGDAPPRYVIVVGLNEWLLLDRYKWPNNRALRFDWNEILDRKDTSTLQAAAALLHRESLAPDAGRQPVGVTRRKRPQACLRRERGPEIRDA